jgi:enoyl-CoA hydratase
VTLKREGAIGIVRFEREHGNAINDAFVESLVAVLAEAESDPAISGVLLTAGGKIFCPGLDLQELSALDREAMERFMWRFSAAVLTLYTFPKPVVALLHGHALAGGCVLALCADWRVLRRGAVTGLNEVRVGVPLPFGVALIVREGVPKNKITEVALLGRNFSDEAAVAAGLADELVDAEGIEAASRARLDEFVAKVNADCAGDQTCVDYWSGACALTVQSGKVPKPWTKYVVAGVVLAAAGYYVLKK